MLHYSKSCTTKDEVRILIKAFFIAIDNPVILALLHNAENKPHCTSMDPKFRKTR